MKVRFIINENYLIVRTLTSKGHESFSSKKYRRDIMAFQRFAWKKSKKHYNILGGWIYPSELTDIEHLFKRLPQYLKALKKSRQFKKVLSQTQKYVKFLEKQWGENSKRTLDIVKELTGLKFRKNFSVYVTHPSLRTGHYLGNNQIAWGHNEDLPNYSIIYLWHEILHSYMGYSYLEHALIQLIIDSELRIRLNGGKYPPFICHEKSLPLMKRLLPHWKKYLKADSKDILKFKKQVEDNL